MKVAVAAEVDANEPRVAATPETIKKIIGLGRRGRRRTGRRAEIGNPRR